MILQFLIADTTQCEFLGFDLIKCDVLFGKVYLLFKSQRRLSYSWSDWIKSRLYRALEYIYIKQSVQIIIEQNRIEWNRTDYNRSEQNRTEQNWIDKKSKTKRNIK